MKQGWLLVGLLGLLGCGDKEEDTASVVVQGSPYLNVLAPMDGAFLDEGQAVQLLVEGRHGDGSAADIVDVVWSGDAGWSAEGNDIEVSDLPAGLYDLQVVGVVDGEAVAGAVEIAVYAAR